MLCQGPINSSGRPANARIADAHLQDRQEKATAAKAGVRRRRGPRMQVYFWGILLHVASKLWVWFLTDWWYGHSHVGLFLDPSLQLPYWTLYVGLWQTHQQLLKYILIVQARSSIKMAKRKMVTRMRMLSIGSLGTKSQTRNFTQGFWVKGIAIMPGCLGRSMS